MLPWMIEVWMRNHLVSDTWMQPYKYVIPPQNFARMTNNNVGLTFDVGDTRPWLTISIEQDN
jgi:hypothetical protein